MVHNLKLPKVNVIRLPFVVRDEACRRHRAVVRAARCQSIQEQIVTVTEGEIIKFFKREAVR